MTVAHTPVRTCIGCRARESWEGLARLIVWIDSEDRDQPHIRVDSRHRLGGRGAWIHPTQRCWEKALKRNAFARAFRRPIGQAELPREFSITESG